MAPCTIFPKKTNLNRSSETQPQTHFQVNIRMIIKLNCRERCKDIFDHYSKNAHNLSNCKIQPERN